MSSEPEVFHTGRNFHFVSLQPLGVTLLSFAAQKTCKPSATNSIFIRSFQNVILLLPSFRAESWKLMTYNSSPKAQGQRSCCKWLNLISPGKMKPKDTAQTFLQLQMKTMPLVLLFIHNCTKFAEYSYWTYLLCYGPLCQFWCFATSFPLGGGGEYKLLKCLCSHAGLCCFWSGLWESPV